MSTTTLRIDESLRDRITKLAQKADEAEWRLGVQQEAHQRDVALQAGEPGVEWHEMKTYLQQRLTDAQPKSKARD